MSISRAVPADAHRVSALAIETFPLACPPGTTEQNIQLFCEQKLSGSAFEAYMEDDRYRIWIASDESSALGYVMSVVGEPEDRGIAELVVHRPTVEISKIYVTEEAQGSGVSLALMDTALMDADAQGALSVWLGVNQHNSRANRFYERLGFAVVGTRAFHVGESLEEDFVREKAL